MIWSDLSIHQLMACRPTRWRCNGATHFYIDWWLVDRWGDIAMDQPIYTSVDGLSTHKVLVLWRNPSLYQPMACWLMGWWCYGVTHLYIDRWLVSWRGDSAGKWPIFTSNNSLSAGKAMVLWNDPSLHSSITCHLVGWRCYGAIHLYIYQWLIDW